MGTRKGPWNPSEDDLLLRLVGEHGAHNWVRIAQCVTSRTPKQCRERYHQNLKPSLNHEPITREEGLVIERLVEEIGKRWAEIARHLPGRSDNAVKNWWNGGENRRKRMHLRQHPYRRLEAGRGRGRFHEPLSPPSALSPSPRTSPIMPLSHHHQYQPQPVHISHDPLPSPALTDVFRHDYRDVPYGTAYSASETSVQSPRTPSSPHSVSVSIVANERVSLPPLLGHHDQYQRRFSLPGGYALSSTEPKLLTPPAAVHADPFRFAVDTKLDYERSRRPSHPDVAATLFPSPTSTASALSPAEHSNYSYERAHTSLEHATIPRLATSLLPPLTSRIKSEDNRMKLASLLS